MITVNINGVDREVDADSGMPLLWAIRDILGMTSTKFGCGLAQCGASTVHLDGQPIRSCQTALGGVGTAKITTIEEVSGKIAETVQAGVPVLWWRAASGLGRWPWPLTAVRPKARSACKSASRDR